MGVSIILSPHTAKVLNSLLIKRLLNLLYFHKQIEELCSLKIKMNDSSLPAPLAKRYDKASF
jgi:hypothetical protein